MVKHFLFAFFCVGLIAGCEPARPIAPDLTATNDNIIGANTHVSEARKELKTVIPAIQPPIKNHVVAADAKLEQAQGNLSAASKSANKLAEDSKKNFAVASKATAAIEHEKTRADKYEQKYRDSWLGGKAKKAIGFIIAIFIGLLILDAVLPVGVNPLYLIFKLFKRN